MSELSLTGHSLFGQHGAVRVNVNIVLCFAATTITSTCVYPFAVLCLQAAHPPAHPCLFLLASKVERWSG